MTTMLNNNTFSTTKRLIATEHTIYPQSNISSTLNMLLKQYLDMYLGDAQFKSLPGHRLLHMTFFAVSLRPSGQMLE
jgi:hypothetical protein